MNGHIVWVNGHIIWVNGQIIWVNECILWVVNGWMHNDDKWTYNLANGCITTDERMHGQRDGYIGWIHV